MSSRSTVAAALLGLLNPFHKFIIVLLCCCLIISRASAQLPSHDWPQTVAESSGFTRTATVNEVQEFLIQLIEDWDDAELIAMGETVEGRVIQAVSLGIPLSPIHGIDGLPVPTEKADRAMEDPFSGSKLSVMVMGGIHPGECDGKEAILAYLRDLKRSGLDDFQSLRLIFLPLLNADGEARRGIHHRPGQAGPIDGMGVRENAQGLDLNRDFVKLDSPEVRSVVSAIASWDIDVLIDLHTTNGSLHRYDLTYDIPHNPAASQILDDFLRTELLPEVTRNLNEKDIPTFFYGNFASDHSRWETYGHQPRYSTEYMGLRGKIGILSESYSYAPYEKRFRASYQFVDEVLRHLAMNSGRIREMIETHQRQLQRGAEVPIAGKLALSEESVIVRGFKTDSGKPATAPPDSHPLNSLTPEDYSVELWNRAEPIKTVSLPAAYAIDSQYAWAVGRLLRHGIPVYRLPSDQQLSVEVATVTEVQSGRSYQGHRPKTLTAGWRSELKQLDSGTFIVPAIGALGKLVAYLLEPQSDESLATWNFFDPGIVANSDYPVLRLSEWPDVSEPLREIPRTEVLTLEKLMGTGENVSLSGGNLVQSVSWLPGSDPIEAVYQRDEQWYAIDVESGATRRLNELSELEKKLASLNGFSAAEARSVAGRSRIWAGNDPYSLIRHRGELYLYRREDGSVRQLSNGSDRSMQLVELSPTGEHIAFIRDNNLWIIDCQSGKESQLTDDGSPEVLNGILDWVYQEELYGRGNFKGYWWSPDGKKIAWLQLDQTEVPEYLVADSVSIAQSLERTRYPKAGQPIPTARIWISGVADGARCEADLQSYPIEDRLVGRVSWSPDKRVWLQVLNRVQNQQDLVWVDPYSGQSTKVFSEATEGWIELRDTPHFLADGKNFLWLSDVPDGRTHLYQVEIDTGKRLALTSGPWDVKELVTISEDQSTAFVTGNYGSPIESHLVSIDLATAIATRITHDAGTHSVSVHPSGRFYIDSFSSISRLSATSVHSMDGQRQFVISAPINDRKGSLKIQEPILVTIPARDGFLMQAMVMLPWGVNSEPMVASNSSTKEDALSGGEANGANGLPVLFHVYAGPQAPIVRNQSQQRNYWWHQLLCSNGYAVVLVDNRSSQGRGIADTWKIRGNMGRIELQDLEDAVSWVAKQGWADPSRFGLWGWSYGGYMTAYAMTNSRSFKAGISGAPVTDWRNYDAIYTERYMDLPSSNESGYQSSSAVQAAAQLNGRLMLIHGEKDDNVHLSNTLQLVYALQQAGKQFDLMIYPRARHGVVDPKQRYHMHQMMTEFLERHLKN